MKKLLIQSSLAGALIFVSPSSGASVQRCQEYLSTRVLAFVETMKDLWAELRFLGPINPRLADKLVTEQDPDINNANRSLIEMSYFGVDSGLPKAVQDAASERILLRSYSESGAVLYWQDFRLSRQQGPQLSFAEAIDQITAKSTFLFLSRFLNQRLRELQQLESELGPGEVDLDLQDRIRRLKDAFSNYAPRFRP